jgi:two-component system alkaline phosphatase synthesis response regulator PhoP
MPKNQILIVEDEKNLGLTLSEYLNSNGFACEHATNVREAKILEAKEDFHPKIILMDIELPDGNGIDLAKEFRAKRKDFLLLFLSAQNDPETKLAGLEMGAEDYITKPFALKELTLRLSKAMQNFEQLEHYKQDVILGSITIKFKSYEVQLKTGETIGLGQKECAILEKLYAKRNTVVSRDEIIEEIWGEDAFPTNRTVDNYIVRLRKILERGPKHNSEIKSVRGVGYQLTIFNNA